jgi:hypothetical protein
MGYLTVSTWTTTEWTDALEAVARDRFLPLIMTAGASGVRMIRTGDLSFSVVTEYDSEANAASAQAKIADIRAKATEELPMTMTGVSAGAVFAMA